MLRACLGLAFGLALFVSAAAEQCPDHAEATRRVVIVNVNWMASYVEADEVCSRLGGIKQPTQTILACYDSRTSTIYAVQPSSFNDLYNLAILGHEFWHALGAEHPAD